MTKNLSLMYEQTTQTALTNRSRIEPVGGKPLLFTRSSVSLLADSNLPRNDNFAFERIAVPNDVCNKQKKRIIHIKTLQDNLGLLK